LKRKIIITAIFGYVLGFHSIYLFHLFALAWIFRSVSQSLLGISIVVYQKKLLKPILIFVIYTFVSIIWHPDFIIWAKYQFYLLCGLIALLAVYQSANNINELNLVFKLIVIYLGINFFVGLLESFNIMRLPMSRYSPYANYFGVEGLDVGSFDEERLIAVGKKPTGFNFNPNNFGFVVMLALPFILFWKKKIQAFIGIILAIWLLISIGSKSLFLAFIFMIASLPFYYRLSYKKIMLIFFIPVVLLLILFLPKFFLIENSGLSRMYSSFDVIQQGVKLILSGQIVGNDSTSFRALNYLFGIQELIKSHGLGLGFGGIQARLIEENFKIQAFHFFFLQMLVDLGVIYFTLFMIFYMKLIYKLNKFSKNNTNKQLSYYMKSASLSLFVAIPASVAPSGIHYLLTFYILIGFSLLLLKINAKEII